MQSPAEGLGNEDRLLDKTCVRGVRHAPVPGMATWGLLLRARVNKSKTQQQTKSDDATTTTMATTFFTGARLMQKYENALKHQQELKTRKSDSSVALGASLCRNPKHA